MTARAFLRLSDELRDTFSRLQDDETLRYVRVEIVGEDTLTVVASRPKGSSLEADFDSLSQEVKDRTPTLFLLALDIEEMRRVSGKGSAAGGSGSSNNGEGSVKRWLLVAWIPDDSKVRDKMLYSSAKQDLRQGLGLGYFEGEFYANVVTDLSFESLLDSRRSGTGDQLLSEAELLKRELNKQERASDAGMKSAAMGIIPFALTDDLRAQLQAFALGEEVNWIEMRMEGEKITLAGANTVAADAMLGASVTADEPRFILMRRQGSRFLVYSCPEESPVRLKMTYSSSKASVVAAAAEAGGKVDHMVEIRAPNEIDEAVALALRGSSGGAAGGGGSAVGGDREGALVPTPAVSRPSRPGRGRARLTKRSS